MGLINKLIRDLNVRRFDVFFLKTHCECCDISHLTFIEGKAQIFVSYGISLGFKVWFPPWRARKTISIPNRLLMSNLFDGFSYGVSKLNSTIFLGFQSYIVRFYQ